MQREAIKGKKQEEIENDSAGRTVTGKHIKSIFSDAYGMLRNAMTSFNYMDKTTMTKIFHTMIRHKLQYAEVVWFPKKRST